MTPLINADKSWVEDLEFVFKYGNHVSPRGMLCLEALALRSVVSMANPIILNSRRRLGYKFMAAEAAWIISGRNDVASISQYSKDISKFSDDGITFYGAYGPRFRDQYDYVLGCLKKDIDSRQALATIWELVKDYHKNPRQFSTKEILALLYDFDKVLGLKLKDIKVIKISAEIKKLVQVREILRREKRWEEADMIRAQIRDLGFEIRD